MPSYIRLVSAICDHLLSLLPEEPARAKRLDDIIDPGDEGEPLEVTSEPPSGLRRLSGAVARRAAS